MSSAGRLSYFPEVWQNVPISCAYSTAVVDGKLIGSNATEKGKPPTYQLACCPSSLEVLPVHHQLSVKLVFRSRRRFRLSLFRKRKTRWSDDMSLHGTWKQLTVWDDSNMGTQNTCSPSSYSAVRYVSGVSCIYNIHCKPHSSQHVDPWTLA